MIINFTKMQGAGNDFVMIDAYSLPISLNSKQIKQIADRHFGVGCDQLLMVEKATAPNVDFRYRIFNADGGEVAQCGNGARCFVRFVIDKGLTKKREIVVETLSGVISLYLQGDGQVTVNMGPPRFNPADIPFITPKQQQQYLLPLANQTATISAVSMGNPHAVIVVDAIDSAPVADWGPQIEAHAKFPDRVNAGFMQIISPHEVKLRVFERGSGETLSCGTGACAAVACGIQLGQLQSPVAVHTRGGTLTIVWLGEGAPVMMTGPATIVFEGSITI